MKTPNYIYVPVAHLGPEDGDTLCPIWWRKDKSSEHEEVVGSIKYVRNDAILGSLLGFMREKKDEQVATIVGEILERFKAL